MTTNFNLIKYEMNQIPLKTEKDFPGLWESLQWEFLGRLHENVIDMKTKLSDFDHIRILGEGGFGKVFLSKHKKNGSFFAMKIMEKNNIVKLKQVEIAANEKRVLTCCKFKFLLKMLTAFQTKDYLCFCLELAPGGDLFGLMENYGPFDNSTTRFYSGQVVLGLQYLHTMKIIYRDLKPENVLISKNGYIKLADMGFAKILHDRTRTYTFCGTPEYIAPEIILNTGYGTAVDWWSFGVLLYEFLAARTPFYHKNQMRIFKCITRGRYLIPVEFSNDAKNLTKYLLQVDVTKRIGNLRNGALDVRYHPFYKITSWTSLMEQTISPPFPVVDPDYSSVDIDPAINQFRDLSTHRRYSKEFQNF